MGARGMVSLAPLALLLALSATGLHARAAAAQEIQDQVLPGCGICYPGGYDVNTFGEVTGSVVELKESAEGPMRFVLAVESERWVVLASPAWFWKSAKRRLQSGDAVTVRGSKTLGADGALYVVAREIQPAGDAPPIVLRDHLGTPLWSGHFRASRIAGGVCRSQEAGGSRKGGAGPR